MVTEGRIKQKKLENQQKLEAKLHGLEVKSFLSHGNSKSSLSFKKIVVFGRSVFTIL